MFGNLCATRPAAAQGIQSQQEERLELCAAMSHVCEGALKCTLNLMHSPRAALTGRPDLQCMHHVDALFYNTASGATAAC